MLVSSRRNIVISVILGWFLTVSMAYAAIVPQLYEVQLTAQTQLESEREQLIKQGFIQIVERISGDPQIDKNPKIKKAMDKAKDYVEQYAYQDKVLIIKFTPELINNLIYKTGKAVWGQRRPQMLLWIGVEENLQRRILGVETDPLVEKQVALLSQQRGLPITLPLMDLQDLNNINADALWNLNNEILHKASARYEAQAILIGKITHGVDGQVWTGTWQLISSKDAPFWTVTGSDLAQVLDQGITNASSHLMPQNAVSVKTVPTTSNNPTRLLMGVNNVQSANDFINIEDYLKTLEPISQVKLHEIIGQNAVFEVISKKGMDQQTLMAAIGSDNRFIAIDPLDMSSQNGIDIAYRWTP